MVTVKKDTKHLNHNLMSITKQIDPEFADILKQLMEHARGYFDEKTTELMLFGMALSIQDRDKIVDMHAKFALDNGATKSDLLAVAKLAFLIRAMAGYGKATDVLAKYLDAP